MKNKIIQDYFFGVSFEAADRHGEMRTFDSVRWNADKAAGLVELRDDYYLGAATVAKNGNFSGMEFFSEDSAGYFVNAVWENNDFSGSTWHATLEDLYDVKNCSFVGCDFEESEIKECRFVGCDFSRADLSKVYRVVYNTFIDCNFYETKMPVVIAGQDYPEDVEDNDFTGCYAATEMK